MQRGEDSAWEQSDLRNMSSGLCMFYHPMLTDRLHGPVVTKDLQTFGKGKLLLIKTRGRRNLVSAMNELCYANSQCCAS